MMEFIKGAGKAHRTLPNDAAATIYGETVVSITKSAAARHVLGDAEFTAFQAARVGKQQTTVRADRRGA